MNSTRLLFGIFNWLREQERTIDRVSQLNSSFNAALQGGYNAGNLPSLLCTLGHDGRNGNCQSNNSVQMGKTGDVLEVGYGQRPRGHLNINVAQSHRAGIQSVHYVSHTRTPWLKARFGRFFRIRVKSWVRP